MAKDTWGAILVDQIPKLRRYARALTKDPVAAEDLVQDCLERAWTRGHLWRDRGDPRPWLFTIMHNVFVNTVRSHNRRRGEVGYELSEDLHDPRPPSQERAMNLRDLDSALQRLPGEQREVLLLVCLEEMTYQQVADVLGLPIGTVMSRLHRARERLREILYDAPVKALRRVK